MNSTRIALIGCFAACALAAWPRKPAVLYNHLPTRQLIIASTLARVDDAVVVLGDSIVEASTLPRSVCGHAIVNAGIGGASTESNLGSLLSQALGARRAALVVVALGTNDAAIPNSVERYRSNYRKLLGTIADLTSSSAILAIPPPEEGLEQAKKVNAVLMDSYNATLPELAKEVGALFVPLAAMPERHTLDGIHLNAAGYEVWDKAILGGIESTVCKSPETTQSALP
ncbi:MAG TPA: SGNH/GDSL hydrolase family protein [Bryobacteraceae bacterium]|jgi:lysophospholipase L1-like esterase